MTATVLEVEQLTKNYGAAVALAGVSFQVADGDAFGLLGPNGAGKTTLLSILACLSQPTSGEARILAHRASPEDRALRAMIGVVPQELAIYGELSARENLKFFGSLYGLAGKTLEDRVVQVLEEMGLADRADDRSEIFSGGMKRRLNLGAALVHRPRLLLLDEPTTGVDPQSRNHIFEAIRRLNADGTTIIYTSHYMEEVQSLCRTIGIIDHGRLAACDTLPGLLKTLDGLVRFQVAGATPALLQRLRDLPESELATGSGSNLELTCRDAKTTVVRLVALLNEMQVELVSLEMVEPNLERVP